MTRRRVLLAVLTLLLFVVVSVAWTLAGLPPVKYYLRYGLDPYCEPTGAKETHECVEFIEIGPGIFRMGSTYLAGAGDSLGKLCAPLGLPWGKHPEPSNEMPTHWVEFRRGFWIATTETTNAQYERFRPEHASDRAWAGDHHPLAAVDREIHEYLSWLAAASGRPVRLPSEAEWECACRAGIEAEFSFGDDEGRLGEHAWFRGNEEVGARTVATREPNAWGLYDMHGNVWEWCADVWQESYVGAPADGSPWRGRGGFTVRRGGGFRSAAGWCRSAFRMSQMVQPRPGVAYTDFGFRPAFSNPDD